jgi:hypothetical protein
MPRGVPNTQTANGKTITKTDAVRQALAELGRDAKPTQIREWINETFQIDVEPNSISALKTMMNKQKPLGRKGHLSKKVKKSSVSRVSSVRAVTASVSAGFTLAEIHSVKQVIDQIGADKVQKLATVLAE